MTNLNLYISLRSTITILILYCGHILPKTKQKTTLDEEWAINNRSRFTG